MSMRTALVLLFVGLLAVTQRAFAQVAVPMHVEHRLPCTVAFLKQKGLTIVEVDEQSPGKKLTDVTNASKTRNLQVGDVVSQIDGKPIKSIQDYFDRLKQVRKTTTIKIRTADNGAESQWLVNPIAVNVPDHLAPTGNVTGARVHVIHAALTEDVKIGPSIRQDLDQFEQCVRKLVGGKRLASFTPLVGSNCTVVHITKTIRELDVNNNDSVFFYYQGHGGNNPKLAAKDPARGHFFVPSGPSLPRSELLKLLAAKRPRFTLLVSDCCDQTADFQAVVETRTKELIFTGWSKLEDLLLCHRGIVDLNACSPGERSWFDVFAGGWFTEVFVTNVYSGAKENDVRHWSEFVGELGSKMDDFFDERREHVLGVKGFNLIKQQKTMHPAIFTMDMQREEPTDPPKGERVVEFIIPTIKFVKP
jgi:hypothetical protein